MWPFLQWLVAAIVWTLANVVYLDMRRKVVGGFGRFAAFWVGFPGTYLTLLVVEERPEVEPPADDEEQLLRDVIRDREARIGRRGEAGGKD